MAAIDILGPIPAATNWVKNPSFETGVANWSTGNSTVAQTLLNAKAGAAAARVTITGVGGPPLLLIPQADRPAAVPNDIANARFFVFADASRVGKRVFAQIIFYNVSTTLTTISGATVTLAAGWNEVRVTDAQAPASTTAVGCQLNWPIGGAAPILAVSDIFDVDMVDLRINQPLDSYIDGAQGALYHWTGTAHASPSIRDEDVPVGLAGYGGQITVSTRVYRSNALGTEYEELSDYVLDGEIANDIDRDIKGSCSLQVSDVTKFTPFSWIKIYADRTREGIGTDTNIVGLFRIGLPESTYPSKTGTFNGLDVTVQLADTVTTGTYVVAAGTVVTTAIAALLDSAGFAGRYQIPASALTVPTEGKQWPRGTSYLVIINALLYDIGYYALYMNPDGTLASIPYQDRKSAEVAHTFTLGADAELLEQIDQTLSEDNLYNYVIATYTKPSGTVVTRTAENKNPAHPYSTVSLGALAGLPKVYRTLAIEANDVVDSTTLQALAREQLDRASMIRYVRMSILPHPDHRPHEIAELDFAGTGSEELSGRYFIESSSFGIGAGAGTMMMSGRKVETYD